MRASRTSETTSPDFASPLRRSVLTLGLAASLLLGGDPLWAAPTASPSPLPVASPTAAPAPAASPAPATSPSPASAAPSPAAPSSSSASHKDADTAAGLRVQMSSLYEESGLLAWSVIVGSTAGKRSEDQMREAASAYDDSASRLGRLYSQLYGDRVGSELTALLKKHVAVLGDYARAAVKGDKPGQDTARKFLVDMFPNQMNALLGPLSRAPQQKDGGAPSFAAYAQNLVAAADAQVARDFNTEYRALDVVYDTLTRVADEQAEAAVRAQPTRYVGATSLPAVDLRVRLTSRIALQMFTLAMANRAMVASNIDEYYALFARCDLITASLSREIAAFGGAELGTQFSAVWKKYIASLQDYEKAKESDDRTMQKRVRGDFTGHASELAALLLPPPPVRAVPPPKKPGKKPKTPPPSPLMKRFQSFFDANLSIIDDEVKKRSPFGPLQHGWSEARALADAITAQVVSRFGETPPPPSR